MRPISIGLELTGLKPTSDHIARSGRDGDREPQTPDAIPRLAVDAGRVSVASPPATPLRIEGLRVA